MSLAAEGMAREGVDVSTLVYKHEGSLFVIHVLIASVFWLLVIVGTFGIALLYLLVLFIGYLFAHSALIAWVKGNGVRITAQQFPDLHTRYMHCCRTLDMDVPDAYVINGSGVLNAFATKFLGRYFVVLYSNIVDSMMERPDAINFYMGHELAHIKRRHLVWGPYIWPASILPLIGAGYSRAREYTCDAFGRACCADEASAVKGLVALAAGERRWAVLNVPAYLDQVKETSGFWMSFHELVADYPWIVKRVARMSDAVPVPSRNPLAWLFALFIPRLGVGGGAGGILIVVAIIGILAAIAIPAYQDYVARAKTMEAVALGRSAADAVADHFYKNGAVPQTLEQAGFLTKSPAVQSIVVSPKGIVILTMATAPLTGKTLSFYPSMGEDKRIKWRCASEEIQPKFLPSSCRP